jgi:rhodanese-related sulfurtransferase
VSARAARTLHKQGIDARVLAGGVGGFRRSGGSLETSSETRNQR